MPATALTFEEWLEANQRYLVNGAVWEHMYGRAGVLVWNGQDPTHNPNDHAFMTTAQSCLQSSCMGPVSNKDGKAWHPLSTWAKFFYEHGYKYNPDAGVCFVDRVTARVYAGGVIEVAGVGEG